MAALRLKDTSELMWEAVTADLIQKWERQKLNKTVHSKEVHTFKKQKPLSAQAASHEGHKQKSDRQCGFCGKSGHHTPECYWNPENPKCVLTDQAKKKLKRSNGKDGGEKGKNALRISSYIKPKIKKDPRENIKPSDSRQRSLSNDVREEERC